MISVHSGRSRPARLTGALLAAALVVVGSPSAALAGAPTHTAGRHNATVTAGPVRIQVLSSTLLRLEYAEDRRFEDAPSFVASVRKPRPTRFTVRETARELRIRTDGLALTYRKGTGAFTPDNTTLELTVGGRRVRAHPAFGSPDRPDQLGGWYRGLDYYPDQAGSPDEIDLHQGLLHRDGWYLLDDTTTALRKDGWIEPRPARTGAYQDGYLFGYGHDYKRALGDLRELSGPTPLLPRWAFGVWFSKYQAYRDQDYREDLLPAFRRHGVPLDMLAVDTDFKAPHTWAGWGWNPDLFPDPEGFLKW
ncbi:MAG TPA: TIM-barrel domain-containing protein, partial [Micromonosporaceae bacterium]|nr:TIM-barrel domain-containing protein [Micromonosporaceae bacterium]